VIGDGEAETGPLATSWHSNKFLNPRTDGAVLPILHLNGYKIANPTVLARMPHDELEACSSATATSRGSSKATTPMALHDVMAATLEQCLDEIGQIQARARDGRRSRHAAALADDRAAHAEGLDRPEAGRRQADRGPLALAPGAARGAGAKPDHLRALEQWLKSYRPKSCSTTRALKPELAALAPTGDRGWARPARERRRLLRDLRLPDFPRLRGRRAEAGRRDRREHARARLVPARRDAPEPRAPQFPDRRTGRDRVEPAGRVCEVTGKTWLDETLPTDTTSRRTVA
jgi:xylulose-5-phosphate/fructose-6-phosphate phosphoketolase